MKEVQEAIQQLTKRVKSSMDPGDALKITQSALNLAHTLNLLQSVQKFNLQTTKPKA